ncbi:hypothetical protein CC1G_07559 [Coprinopsis cinerea okayama7|uniref:Cyclin-like domain-containing protein n=1 Tax=Coprinopsis cinerea (strain Okayama-7 / 130 / ATCC MYA-4618 / FGSC 9003) TaxID=240176 RepID=A8NUK8_COPC7|nr:hypothetical protein CC1G_07559 [Coprinopsis cinerea okayama7\|eukprot:XP_001836476.2 hypothetical protein CC1G_07559 [Coprinopsis cinerea okayama7\
MSMPEDSSPSKTLVNFIATLIRRAALDPSIPYAALLLLQRLKQRYPTARATGHRLYFAAFMLASKILSDTEWTVRSWRYSAQWSFSRALVLEMERELCQCLDWDLNFDFDTLSTFHLVVRRIYSRDRHTYPVYSLLKLSRRTDPVASRRGSPKSAESESLPSPCIESSAVTTSSVAGSSDWRLDRSHTDSPSYFADDESSDVDDSSSVRDANARIS